MICQTYVLILIYAYLLFAYLLFLLGQLGLQLEADCFLVKDIVKIISTIELEENRMDCIVASLTQVYDLAVISELLNLVILERNKEAIQQKISQLQNQ